MSRKVMWQLLVIWTLGIAALVLFFWWAMVPASERSPLTTRPSLSTDPGTVKFAEWIAVSFQPSVQRKNPPAVPESTDADHVFVFSREWSAGVVDFGVVQGDSQWLLRVKDKHGRVVCTQTVDGQWQTRDPQACQHTIDRVLFFMFQYWKKNGSIIRSGWRISR